jgi:dephospho-CoA kinase
MMVLALTGSIGMGKSTVGRFFREAGVPVWDADEAVHRLYGPGAAGTEAIAALAPEAVVAEGVDRGRLREAILEDPDLLKRIEGVIHPLVSEDRDRFLAEARARGEDIVLCDIPLLFETGIAEQFDRVIVVSAPPEVQRRRVLARGGMTERAFEAILAKQTPDAEKRTRADHVIDTSGAFSETRRQVEAILDELRETGDA